MAHRPASPAVSSTARYSPRGVSPDRPLVVEDAEIVAPGQAARDVEGGLVQPGVRLGCVLRARQDQRRSRLVDEHAVRLVDDSEMQAAQQQRLRRAGPAGLEQLIDHEAGASAALAERQTIAQVIEDDLLIGAVGHVAAIGPLAILRRLPLDDEADAQAERFVDRRELLGVAPGQIIVDGHDMHGTAAERRGNRRQQGGQGLAFAGLHFGERATHHGGAGDELDAEMSHSDGAARGLAGQREGPGRGIAARLRHCQPAAQCVGALPQVSIAQPGQLRLEMLNLAHQAIEAPAFERRQVG